MNVKISTMVTIIKSSSSKAQIKKLLNQAMEVQGVDTHRYCGVIKLQENPLVIQKRLRDEWE